MQFFRTNRCIANKCRPHVYKGNVFESAQGCNFTVVRISYIWRPVYSVFAVAWCNGEQDIGYRYIHPCVKSLKCMVAWGRPWFPPCLPDVLPQFSVPTSMHLKHSWVRRETQINKFIKCISPQTRLIIIGKLTLELSWLIACGIFRRWGVIYNTEYEINRIVKIWLYFDTQVYQVYL